MQFNISCNACYLHIFFYTQINHDEKNEHPVELKDASFSWSDDHLKDGCSLADISWHVPDGYLVAVVGAVGTGKSSLLSGIILIHCITQYYA